MKVKVGWVKGLNHLYFLYEAIDNYWDFAAPDLHNDIFEVVVDGDLSGGPLIRQMHPNRSRARYELDPITLDTHFAFHGVHAQNYHIFTPAEGQRLDDGRGAASRGSRTCPMPMRRTSTTSSPAKAASSCWSSSSRRSITPSRRASARSVESKLAEDKVIGMSWAVLDYDDVNAPRPRGVLEPVAQDDDVRQCGSVGRFSPDAARSRSFVKPLRGEMDVPGRRHEPAPRRIQGSIDRRCQFVEMGFWRRQHFHEQHPQHVYPRAGDFVVTLDVAGPGGTSRLQRVWDVLTPVD